MGDHEYHTKFYIFKLYLSRFHLDLFSLVEGKLGKIDASLLDVYDSQCLWHFIEFLQLSKNFFSSAIAQDELKSEDDFIIGLPHPFISQEVKWFTFTDIFGIQFTQYVKNDDKSYT